MACACDQCLQHSRTLGLSGTPTSKAALQKAYRAAAKRWHPDRFERDPAMRPEAEEHFKRVQIAYRELAEHHGAPVDLPLPTVFAKPAPPPPFSFGNAPGCFTAPHFPAFVESFIADHLGPNETALGIVDLSRPGAEAGDFSQFILLGSHAVVVRDALNIVSLIWYTGIGEVSLTDRRTDGKLSFLQRLAEKISGPRPNYSLQIYRRNGTLFYSLGGQADDRVKKVIYNFLLRKKYKAHP